VVDSVPVVELSILWLSGSFPAGIVWVSSGIQSVTIIRTAEKFGYFRLTAETVSEESCQDGDISTRATWEDDYVFSEWDFRDIYDRFRGHRWEGDGSNLPRWITFSKDDLATMDTFSMALMSPEDISISYSVHRPGWITDASWRRVCVALGWNQR